MGLFCDSVQNGIIAFFCSNNVQIQGQSPNPIDDFISAHKERFGGVIVPDTKLVGV